MDDTSQVMSALQKCSLKIFIFVHQESRHNLKKLLHDITAMLKNISKLPGQFLKNLQA